MDKRFFAVWSTSHTIRQTVTIAARALLAFIAFALMARSAYAQTGDYQFVPVGGTTTAFGRIIIAGLPGSNNGICDAPITLAGDDVQVVLPGNSTPRQVGIRRGANTVLDSTAEGDDVATSVICAGANNAFDSVVAGDDVNTPSDARCAAICPTAACILPGADDILQTTVVPDDEARAFLSTGANGILESTLAGDDIFGPSIFATGTGFRDATCVNAGPDGVAQTSLCGNSYTDVNEDCDQGGIDTATCNANCTNAACGDGYLNAAAGEVCDDGNTLTNDPCPDCHAAACGDGFSCTAVTCTSGPDGGPELCDDGNTVSNDGCSSICKAEFCGDGIVQNGIGEQCEDGNADDTDRCVNCRNAVCGDGFVCSNGACTSGPGGGPEACDDANNDNSDGCVLGCALPGCGDGYVHQGVEQCDPPDATCTAGLTGQPCSSYTQCDSSPGAGDGVCVGCTSLCRFSAPPTCGDGFVDTGEECDDANASNLDDCTTLCQAARCGDGYTHNLQSGGEECDDGNSQSGDGCSSTCKIECGNGRLDGACAQGVTGNDCATNTDCDTSPGAGDGVCAGETCDVGCGASVIDGTCASGHVGADCGVNADCDTGPPNGVCGGSACGPGCSAGLVGGLCSAGSIGAPCTTNSDCDTGPPDGVCTGHACAPAGDTSLFCAAGPDICSDKCHGLECGNGLLECDEECDLGAANGQGASGCSSECRRTFIGKKETTGSAECPVAWSLANPPQSAARTAQVCRDNVDPCDNGTIAGECEFHVAVCLNRNNVPGCDPGSMLTFDLARLRVTRSATDAAAAEIITEAVKNLTPPGGAIVPGRCRAGQRGKSCTIGDDYECDSTFGSHNGRCEIGTGVLFTPAFGTTNKCTDEIVLLVPAGQSLKLHARARRENATTDKDSLRLRCAP